MKFPVNFNALSPQRDAQDKLWFCITDILTEFGCNASNVTFWANSVRDYFPQGVAEFSTRRNRNHVTCLFTDLEGLMYLALRLNSEVASKFKEMLIDSYPLPELPLGEPLETEDGRKWFKYATLIETVVHGGSPPRQTVTTTAIKVPRKDVELLPQRDSKGRSHSMAYHVTRRGVWYYLLNSKHALSYRAELARRLAKDFYPQTKLLGVA